MGMNRTFKAAVAALMLAVGSAGSVAAGPFEDAADALDKRDYATALRLMRPLAEQGLAQAQFSLGQIYYRDIQFAAAAGWYRKAAEQGNAEAQFNLGFMYALGQGVPQRDDAASAGWYSKAAEQGYAKAQVSLGLMCEAGLGVRKENAAAAGWYRKAAEQGNAEAQVFLGVMYREGPWRPAGLCQRTHVVQLSRGQRGQSCGASSGYGRRADDALPNRGSSEARPRVEAKICSATMTVFGG
jgi:uncharacterized protein